MKVKGRRLAAIERSAEPALYLDVPGGPESRPRQRLLGDAWGDRARAKWRPMLWRFIG